MAVAYSVIFAISLLLPIGYYLFVRKKEKELWLCILYLGISVVNLGYLLLSLSKTVRFALFANKIAYLGHVFVILCMFMLIVKLCGFRYKKSLPIALTAVALAMFGIICTTGHLDWYYKSVELIQADGAAKLVKEYGVLHPLYLVYVLANFVGMLAVIIYSFKVKKDASRKLAGLMLAVVFGNVGMWLVEKVVTWNFEFLSVSYLMSECVFFFVYWLLQDYVPVKEGNAEEEKLGVDTASMPLDIKIGKVLFYMQERETLATREREILERILQYKKRKEIAEELHLSENTVKTYTRTLYTKLGVSSRAELYALLTKN